MPLLLKTSTFSYPSRAKPLLCHTTLAQNLYFFIPHLIQNLYFFVPLSLETLTFSYPSRSRPLFFHTGLAQNLYFFHTPLAHNLYFFIPLSLKNSTFSETLHLFILSEGRVKRSVQDAVFFCRSFSILYAMQAKRSGLINSRSRQ